MEEKFVLFPGRDAHCGGRAAFVLVSRMDVRRKNGRTVRAREAMAIQLNVADKTEPAQIGPGRSLRLSPPVDLFPLPQRPSSHDTHLFPVHSADIRLSLCSLQALFATLCALCLVLGWSTPGTRFPYRLSTGASCFPASARFARCPLTSVQECPLWQVDMRAGAAHAPQHRHIPARNDPSIKH